MKQDVPGLPSPEHPTEVYVSDSVHLAQILERILSATGPADVSVSTFSTSEEFLRRFFRLRRSGAVRNCTMYCDVRALAKTSSLKLFMSSVFDSVMLCRNHSKMMLVEGSGRSFAVVTSQNQTRGDRFEAGIITMDDFIIKQVREGLASLASKSVRLDVYSREN